MMKLINFLWNSVSNIFIRTNANQTLNYLPSIAHRVYDDKFIENFDEIVIIGDLHGCFDELLLLLDKIHQNCKTHSKKILKIFTGDLINKGPKNIEVIDYLMNNQDCISVRGNHDEIVLKEYLKFIQTGTISEKNQWMKQISKSQFEYLKELPYTIRILKLNIIVVHAGLLPNIPLKKQNLYDITVMRNIVNKTADDGKKIYIASKSGEVGIPWSLHWPGPYHIYFGHDAKRGLQEYQFATGLDTGCVYGKRLTAKFVMGHRKGQLISVKALKIWRKIEN